MYCVWLAKDSSPVPSPKVITPAADTVIPQYPTAYNGDTTTHIEVTPAATESSPTAYVEAALPEKEAESDVITTKEQVCSLSTCLCIFS